MLLQENSSKNLLKKYHKIKRAIFNIINCI